MLCSVCGNRGHPSGAERHPSGNQMRTSSSGAATAVLGDDLLEEALRRVLRQELAPLQSQIYQSWSLGSPGSFLSRAPDSAPDACRASAPQATYEPIPSGSDGGLVDPLRVSGEEPPPEREVSDTASLLTTAFDSGKTGSIASATFQNLPPVRELTLELGMRVDDGGGEGAEIEVTDLVQTHQSSMGKLADMLEETAPGSHTHHHHLQALKELVGIPKNEANVHQPFEKPFAKFEKFVMVLVVVNSMQVGLCAGHSPWQLTCDFCEYLFTVVFALEAGIKIALWRIKYFQDRMNLIDFAVAVLAVSDVFVLQPVVGTGGGSNFTAFRIFRILKLLRMAKLIKMRQELYMLARGIMGSLRALVWIWMLLGIVIFSGAIFCMEVIDLWKEEYASQDFYEDKFSTLFKASMTLFDICILAEWSDIVHPVMDTQPWLIVFFIVFCCVTNFGLLNVIIGVIAETTSEASKKLAADEKLAKEESLLRHTLDLMTFLKKIDVDTSGTISFEEINGHPEVLEYLRKVNLPTEFTVQELFLVLDTGGDGELQLDEFLLGMCRMIHGDHFQRICMVSLALGRVQRMVIQLDRRMDERIQALVQTTSDGALATKALTRSHAQLFSTSPSQGGMGSFDDLQSKLLSPVESPTRQLVSSASSLSQGSSLSSQLASPVGRPEKECMTAASRRPPFSTLRVDSIVLEGQTTSEKRTAEYAEQSGMPEHVSSTLLSM